MPPYHPRRLDAIQGADVSFLAEQQAKAELRRQRFATEAALPPPIPQPKRIAWPGGKIVTSDKREKLLSLLQRQSHAPTQAQLDALQRLSAAGAPTGTHTDSDSPDTEEAPSPMSKHRVAPANESVPHQNQPSTPQPLRIKRTRCHAAMRRRSQSWTRAVNAFFRHRVALRDVPLSRSARAFLVKKAKERRRHRMVSSSK